MDSPRFAMVLELEALLVLNIGFMSALYYFYAVQKHSIIAGTTLEHH